MDSAGHTHPKLRLVAGNFIDASNKILGHSLTEAEVPPFLCEEEDTDASLSSRVAVVEASAVDVDLDWHSVLTRVDCLTISDVSHLYKGKGELTVCSNL